VLPGASLCHLDNTSAARSRRFWEPSAEARQEVKKVARGLLNCLKQLFVFNGRQKSSVRAQRRLTIESTLDTGRPRVYDNALYEQKCCIFFERYAKCDASFKATAF